ncbi:hypothetical protein GNI_049600 [Gregarina niphandrodes]|uniref:Uncharacterized protein n=1 Tax=Gregarina niphandrodes TaxID=110365 RepID=A0A023B9J7_GRENI|nr:hypothetical protein GNI_049600 [Gregarina niphandrodes]EZG72983.1 hypothetical protein GNI_049600 [Gregarina niphandrodes]|eukprot:XP_011129678.1 hypothetical protein GNI_049600 [Gregarina niphandrodes]
MVINLLVRPEQVFRPRDVEAERAELIKMMKLEYCSDANTQASTDDQSQSPGRETPTTDNDFSETPTDIQTSDINTPGPADSEPSASEPLAVGSSVSPSDQIPDRGPDTEQLEEQVRSPAGAADEALKPEGQDCDTETGSPDAVTHAAADSSALDSPVADGSALASHVADGSALASHVADGSAVASHVADGSALDSPGAAPRDEIQTPDREAASGSPEASSSSHIQALSTGLDPETTAIGPMEATDAESLARAESPAGADSPAGAESLVRTEQVTEQTAPAQGKSPTKDQSSAGVENAAHAESPARTESPAIMEDATGEDDPARGETPARAVSPTRGENPAREATPAGVEDTAGPDAESSVSPEKERLEAEDREAKHREAEDLKAQDLGVKAHAADVATSTDAPDISPAAGRDASPGPGRDASPAAGGNTSPTADPDLDRSVTSSSENDTPGSGSSAGSQSARGPLVPRLREPEFDEGESEDAYPSILSPIMKPPMGTPANLTPQYSPSLCQTTTPLPTQIPFPIPVPTPTQIPIGTPALVPVPIPVSLPVGAVGLGDVVVKTARVGPTGERCAALRRAESCPGRFEPGLAPEDSPFGARLVRSSSETRRWNPLLEEDRTSEWRRDRLRAASVRKIAPVDSAEARFQQHLQEVQARMKRLRQKRVQDEGEQLSKLILDREALRDAGPRTSPIRGNSRVATADDATPLPHHHPDHVSDSGPDHLADHADQHREGQDRMDQDREGQDNDHPRRHSDHPRRHSDHHPEQQQAEHVYARSPVVAVAGTDAGTTTTGASTPSNGVPFPTPSPTKQSGGAVGSKRKPKTVLVASTTETPEITDFRNVLKKTGRLDKVLQSTSPNRPVVAAGDKRVELIRHQIVKPSDVRALFEKKARENEDGDAKEWWLKQVHKYKH